MKKKESRNLFHHYNDEFTFILFLFNSECFMILLLLFYLIKEANSLNLHESHGHVTCHMDVTFPPAIVISWSRLVISVHPPCRPMVNIVSSFRGWRGVCRFPTIYESFIISVCGSSDAPGSPSMCHGHKQEPQPSGDFLEDWPSLAPPSLLQP